MSSFKNGRTSKVDNNQVSGNVTVEFHILPKTPNGNSSFLSDGRMISQTKRTKGEDDKTKEQTLTVITNHNRSTALE